MNLTNSINNFSKNRDRRMGDQSKDSEKSHSAKKGAYPESIFKNNNATSHKTIKLETPNQPCPPKKTTASK